MLKTIFILMLFSLNAFSFGFITSSFHVLQRHDLALAPTPYTDAPFPLFPILYKYITIGDNQQLIVVTNFSSPYILSIFTNTQFEYWILDSTSQAVYVQLVSNGTYYIPLPKGDYVVVINHAVNISPNQVKLYVGTLNFYSIFFSNRNSVATGIASYGFYNYSGFLSPYQIRTTAILGYFNISSLSTKNGLASLQMNAVLQIDGDKSEQFWLQNFLLFNIYGRTYSPGDQIWNFSSYLANVSQIMGNGKINVYDSRTYYSYVPFWYSNTSYSLPLAGYLITNISVVNGKGVYVSFGYVVIQSGNLNPPFVNYYDTVFIRCPDVKSAYILVEPSFTGSLNPYDVELVFGGYSANDEAVFTSLKSQLTLMYYENGKWFDFPSLLSYGLNTQETAGNAKVTIQKGEAIVELGSSDGSFLTNNFNGTIPGFAFVNYSGYTFYTSSPFLVNISKFKLVNNVINYTLSEILLFINGEMEIIPNNYLIRPSTSWFENITIIPRYSTYFKVTLNYPNGTYTAWYLNGSTLVIPKVINVSQDIRYLLNSSIQSILVTSPLNLTLPYVTQFYVNFILPNGSIIGWFTNGSTLVIPKVIQISPTVRYFLNSSTNSFIITSPVTIKPNYVLQYFVDVKYFNGSIIGWFNNGSVITLPKFINISNNARYVLNSNVISVTSPINETLAYTLQYFVVINLPNGSIREWVNNGSVISIPNVIISNNTRYVLNSSTSLIITNSINYTPQYTVEYLVTVILPNGTIITKYLPNGSEIHLPKVIKLSNDTRYLLNSSSKLIVNSSRIIEPAYVLQYLVSINGEGKWINEGENLTIQIFTTPFLLVKWIGNIHVHNGETIVVDKPIYLKAIEEPNPFDSLLMLLSIPIALMIYKRKRS